MRLIDADEIFGKYDLAHCGKRHEDGGINREALDTMMMYEVKAMIEDEPTIDPVHAARGCYCRECRMRTGVETKETVLCGYHGCSMRKDDFCSMGKREETKDG